jgi:hypothetical protein
VREEMKEPQWLRNVRKYALIYGAGGVAALQALKIDIFSFPSAGRIYLGYFFSIITIFCIFLGGYSVIDLLKKMSIIIKKINEIDKTIRNTDNSIIPDESN